MNAVAILLLNTPDADGCTSADAFSACAGGHVSATITGLVLGTAALGVGRLIKSVRDQTRVSASGGGALAATAPPPIIDPPRVTVVRLIPPTGGN